MSDDEDTPDNVTTLDFERPQTPKRQRGRRSKDEERVRREIPRLPATEVTAYDMSNPSDLASRDLACVNMRLMGAPFAEIAQALEYLSATEAKRDFMRALAATHSPEDWDTMRQLEVMRAEQLMRRSFAMAAADYLVDSESGEKIPNTEKLRWHAQAAADLQLHAMISGAKAPTRLEVTPSEAEYSAIVEAILEREGHQRAIEAEIIDVEEVPDAPDDSD